MTPQRMAILAEVQSAERHLTAAEIFERVRRKYPTIAYGTVYRTLHLLAKHGLIQEYPFGDSASRFDRRTDRHDHVHCVRCGELVDVEVPIALLARQVAAEQTGFRILDHQTVFTGICPTCQEQRGLDELGRTGTRR
ncbi:MAG: transcriptional repressor [Thermomicrobium sp.]|nr:transcriptional repressor [Thermomicrobium sp.]MDW7982316.1 transcriptional repressor [Thermomicrobium sp.]